MPDSGKNMQANLVKLGDQCDAWSQYLRERAAETDEGSGKLLRTMLQAIAGGLSYAAVEARRAARYA